MRSVKLVWRSVVLVILCYIAGRVTPMDQPLVQNLFWMICGVIVLLVLLVTFFEFLQSNNPRR